MKPTTLFFSLLGSITVGAMSALPSFTQVPTPTFPGAPVPSTNIPVTGSVTANVNVNGSGGIIITGASVLSSIGTVRITGGEVLGITDSAGRNISSISVGTSAIVSGVANGSANFNDGRTADFIYAPTTLNAIVTSISTGSSLSFFAPPPNTSVTVNVPSGTISVPNSSIVVPTTSVDFTNGNFFFEGTNLLPTLKSGSALTPFGPITFSSISASSPGSARVPATEYSDGRRPRLPIAGDEIEVYSFLLSGKIANQAFADALTSGKGVIQSWTQSGIDSPVYTVSTTFTLAGKIQLPTSLVSSLSGGTTGTSNSPIRSIIFVTDEIARKIFNAQPVLEGSRDFLPPSSLANSRIHPGLGR